MRLAATILALALAVSACTAAPPPLFDYTPAFRDKIIIPLLKQALGDDFQYYDGDTPLIAGRPDGTIVLVFAFDYDKAGCGEYVNPPYVTIVVDPVTRKVRDVITRPPDD